MLGVRVPLWTLIVLLVAGTAVLALSWFLRDVPDLGPAVDGARSITVRITTCNRVVDRNAYNPRKAELDLEHELRRLGARSAEVSVERNDC